MVNIKLDSVSFELKEQHDFSWINSIGKVFTVFSQNDSGNISFGVDNGVEKYFIKVAGLKTARSVCSTKEAVDSLKAAVQVYEEIEHPNLIKLVSHYAVGNIYVAIFKWVEGDCLFDYWNFERYSIDPQIIPPQRRFKQMSIEKRIKSAEALFSVLEAVSKSNYVAVDFYDGSIMYDFNTDTTTICDIDFFRKNPTFNDMGEDYWGTKRLKAPEEYIYGAVINEATNVYTLGALLFSSYFGNYTDDDIAKRYERNAFAPCAYESWELNKESFDVAKKATAIQRSERYETIGEFHIAWNNALLAR